jgi:hypothetical protein
MALPKTIERIEDVPEIVRDYYAEKDGALTLTIMASEEHAGLVTAINDERRLRRETEKSLVEWKTKYEGVDVDEYHKLQDRVKGLDDAEIYDKQGIEALVTRRTDAMKQDHDRQVQAKDREITQLRSTVSESDRRWRNDRIRTALLEAVQKNGVYDKAVDDAVQRGLVVFTDLDEQGLAVAKQRDEVVYGKDGINPLRPDEWISNLKTSGMAPHLWPPSSGGGAPAQHSGNGSGIDWSKLPPAERMTAFRQQQETLRNR